MPVQFAGTNQFPETTEVIQYNILEIDKNGEADTTEDYQQRNRNKQSIMIGHHHRIP